MEKFVIRLLVHLLISSKDTFIKFWDLDTKHCFYTLVGHRSEVRFEIGMGTDLPVIWLSFNQIWSFVLLREDSRLITGSSDFELKVYSLNLNPEPEPVNLKTKRSSPSSEDTESVRMKVCAVVRGVVVRVCEVEDVVVRVCAMVRVWW